MPSLSLKNLPPITGSLPTEDELNAFGDVIQIELNSLAPAERKKRYLAYALKLHPDKGIYPVEWFKRLDSTYKNSISDSVGLLLDFFDRIVIKLGLIHNTIILQLSKAYGQVFGTLGQILVWLPYIIANFLETVKLLVNIPLLLLYIPLSLKKTPIQNTSTFIEYQARLHNRFKYAGISQINSEINTDTRPWGIFFSCSLPRIDLGRIADVIQYFWCRNFSSLFLEMIGRLCIAQISSASPIFKPISALAALLIFVSVIPLEILRTWIIAPTFTALRISCKLSAVLIGTICLIPYAIAHGIHKGFEALFAHSVQNEPFFQSAPAIKGPLLLAIT